MLDRCSCYLSCFLFTCVRKTILLSLNYNRCIKPWDSTLQIYHYWALSYGPIVCIIDFICSFISYKTLHNWRLYLKITLCFRINSPFQIKILHLWVFKKESMKCLIVSQVHGFQMIFHTCILSPSLEKNTFRAQMLPGAPSQAFHWNKEHESHAYCFGQNFIDLYFALCFQSYQNREPWWRHSWCGNPIDI